MAAILVLEDYELDVVNKALEFYKEHFIPEEKDYNFEYVSTRKLLTKINKAARTDQEHNGGKEL